MKNKAKYFLLLGVLFLLPVGFMGYQDKDFALSKNLDIYHSLMRELNLYYVDEIDPGTIVKSSIDQMLSGLDPYTVYIPESQMEDLELMTTGEYGGIGALISHRNGKIIVTDPYEGFPAQKAGLRAGDEIQKIDGRLVEGRSSEEIQELLKGQVGTALKMELDRPYVDQTIHAQMVREKIKIDNVTHFELMDDRTAYIRLGGFTQGAAKEVQEALTQLQEKGAEKLILDLRSNPGGLLIEAVDLMNLFVNQNVEIVSTKGKVKQWNNTYFCRYQPMDTLLPVAVLINSQSASASEIVAGAMQDLDRGIVLGQRSFGKGLVQTTRDLSYNSKLKITTAKYYIPSGRCIQALDYANRRADGSVGNIPDSLISTYTTKNGRTVKDGGGIIPDFPVDPRMLSKLGTALVYQHKIFDFATKLRNTRETIAEPKDYVLPEEDFTRFLMELKKDSFNYETGSERKVTELEQMMVRERYDEIAGAQLKELKKLLASDLDKDIYTFQSEVKTLLTEEILGRYYYQKGRVSHILKEDPVVEKALAVLQDAARYEHTLGIQ